jgi:hypothetical protein
MISNRKYLDRFFRPRFIIYTGLDREREREEEEEQEEEEE